MGSCVHVFLWKIADSSLSCLKMFLNIFRKYNHFRYIYVLFIFITEIMVLPYLLKDMQKCKAYNRFCGCMVKSDRSENIK